MKFLLTRFLRFLSRLLGFQPPRRLPVRTAWDDTSDPLIGWTYEITDPYSQVLLYIGSSKNHPFSRLSDHASKSWWPPHGVEVHLSKWHSYHESHEAEKTLIHRLNPLHNKIRYASASLVLPDPHATFDCSLRLTYQEPQ